MGVDRTPYIVDGNHLAHKDLAAGLIYVLLTDSSTDEARGGGPDPAPIIAAQPIRDGATISTTWSF